MRSDFIIIGQGLAGTTLAWHMIAAGRSVVVLDAEPATTSSRIAAGLMTPITGKRLARTPQYEIAFPIAQQFYTQIETQLGERFFHPRPIVRIFLSAEERNLLQTKSISEYPEWIVQPEPKLNPEQFIAPFGCFGMQPSAQLDVSIYLDASRSAFIERGCYRKTDLNIASDIALSMGEVHLPKLGLSAQTLVFCEGFRSTPNPWFPERQYEAAKGEILTVHVPQLQEDRVINLGGTWLAPLSNGLYRTGSTYDRDNLNEQPTAAGRAEIESKLKRFLRLPFEVTDHVAAVRPIVPQRSPMLRKHAEYPQLALLNGLGSKGSLLAPMEAQRLLAML